MSTRPTNPTTAPLDDAAGPATGGQRPTWQQRFEESRVGRRIVSGLIVIVIGTQVVWSMPDSAIRRALMPVVEPANAINVNERWSMFAPDVGTRREEFEVAVTMADGTSRVWFPVPDSRLEKIVLPDRWPYMAETAMRQQDGRREFARWVVKTVTGPSDRPVKVVMMFRFEVLAPPGQPSKNATGTRVIYEELLTGQP